MQIKRLINVIFCAVICGCTNNQQYSEKEKRIYNSYLSAVSQTYDSYQKILTTTFNERIAETAKEEARLRNEGILKPAYHYKNYYLMRYFPCYNGNKFSISQYDLSEVIAVDSLITKSDFDFLLGYVGSRNHLKLLLEQQYNISDSITLNCAKETAYDIYTMSSFIPYFFPTVNRGLFKFDNSGKPFFDMCKSFEKSNNTYTVEINDEYWKDFNGNFLRKVTAQDFVDAYNLYYEKYLYPCFENIKVIDDSTFEFESINSEPIYQFARWFNYPVASDYRKSMDKYGFSLENTVFNGHYIISENETSIHLHTEEESFIKDIYFIKNDGNNNSIDDVIEGNLSLCQITREEDIASISEYDKYLITEDDLTNEYSLILNPNVGDERYKKALDNKYFRRGIMALLNIDTDFIGKNSITVKTNQCITSNPYYMSKDINYGDIVQQYLEKELSSQDYFELVEEDLGTSFFSEPVHLPLKVYSLSQRNQFANLKQRVEKQYGKYICIDLELDQATDFSWNGDTDSFDKGKFFIPFRMLNSTNDIIDYFIPLVNEGHPLLKFIREVE